VDRSRGPEAPRPGHGQRLNGRGHGTWPRCRPEGDNVIVTMPGDQDDARDPGPLGAEVAPPADEESQGGDGSGVAGPSYPPAETEPDAH
jgi:hypothetical protein